MAPGEVLAGVSTTVRNHFKIMVSDSRGRGISLLEDQQELRLSDIKDYLISSRRPERNGEDSLKESVDTIISRHLTHGCDYARCSPALGGGSRQRFGDARATLWEIAFEKMRSRLISGGTSARST